MFHPHMILDDHWHIVIIIIIIVTKWNEKQLLLLLANFFQCKKMYKSHMASTAMLTN